MPAIDHDLDRGIEPLRELHAAHVGEVDRLEDVAGLAVLLSKVEVASGDLEGVQRRFGRRELAVLDHVLWRDLLSAVEPEVFGAAWLGLAGRLIPGTVGGAVYGNAGAYGHSISERVVNVRFYDGHDTRMVLAKIVPIC